MSIKSGTIECLFDYTKHRNRDKDGILRIWKTKWVGDYSSRIGTDYEAACDLLKAILKYDKEKSYRYFVLEIEITTIISVKEMES